MYFVMDVGGNYIKSGRVNDQGDLIETFPSVKTPLNLSAFEEALEKVLSSLDEKDKGIAISHTGIVDDDRGVLVFNGSLPFLKGYPYREKLQQQYQKKINLINDGQAAVIAEHQLGALKGVANGLALTLGTGLALGIIIDHKLYKGSHNVAGEVSFILPEYSATPLVRQGGVFNFVRPANHLLDCKDENDAENVFKAIRANHQPVINLFNDYCRVIATLIYNLHLVFDVERIAIGGGISNEPLMIEGIRKAYHALYENHPSFVFREEIFEPVPLTTCHFKNGANLLGAYLYAKTGL